MKRWLLQLTFTILANLRLTVNIFPLWSPEFFLRLTFLRLTVKICLLLHLAAKLLAVLQLTVKPIKTFVHGEEELC